MRCDVNVSVRPKGQEQFGTKVEIKNMNSFANMQSAIEYEVTRQVGLLEEGKGGEIVMETRLWDEKKKCTFSMRKKEGLADYRFVGLQEYTRGEEYTRHKHTIYIQCYKLHLCMLHTAYVCPPLPHPTTTITHHHSTPTYPPPPPPPLLRYFPEPDLPPLIIPQEQLETIRTSLPELPAARRARYASMGLPLDTVLVLADEAATGDFFDATVRAGAGAKAASNYLVGDVMAYCKEKRVWGG